MTGGGTLEGVRHGLRHIALTLSLLSVGPVTASGAIDVLSPDPRVQGAVLAAPAIYRVEARYEVRGVRVGRQRILLPPAGRRITEVGTAFGVSNRGHLISVAHVAAPDAGTLARAVGSLALAQRGQSDATSAYVRDWVALNDVRAFGVRRISLTVAAAMPDPGSPRAEYPATVVPGGRAAGDDLVMLKIDGTGTPALSLDTSMTVGTPVATIGFGSQMPTTTLNLPPIPTVRVGVLGRTGTVADEPGSRYTVVSTRVETGDSGGPAVDADGRVHGVVRWLSRRDGGYLIRASRVDALTRRVLGRDPGPPGPAQSDFRRGMRLAWSGHMDAAMAALDAAERRDPGHTLAGPVLERLTRMRAAGLHATSPDWRRSLWFAVSALSALAAAWCAWALLRSAPRSGPVAERRLDD